MLLTLLQLVLRRTRLQIAKFTAITARSGNHFEISCDQSRADKLRTTGVNLDMLRAIHEDYYLGT